MISMMILMIDDDDLMVFLEWYQGHFGRASEDAELLATCMCGYFHTHMAAAKKLLRRCVSSHLVKKAGSVIYLK